MFFASFRLKVNSKWSGEQPSECAEGQENVKKCFAYIYVRKARRDIRWIVFSSLLVAWWTVDYFSPVSIWSSSNVHQLHIHVTSCVHISRNDKVKVQQFSGKFYRLRPTSNGNQHRWVEWNIELLSGWQSENNANSRSSETLDNRRRSTNKKQQFTWRRGVNVFQQRENPTSAFLCMLCSFFSSAQHLCSCLLLLGYLWIN